MKQVTLLAELYHRILQSCCKTMDSRKKCSFLRSGASVAAADRIQFQMTLHEEDEENVDEKDQVGVDYTLEIVYRVTGYRVAL